MNGRRILLGVCGGIAAYKAAALTSRLVQRGAEVEVILTDEAQRFVGAATFAALSRRAVWTSLWERSEEIPHIRLVRDAEVLAIVPATANVIAKLAQGIADDLLTNAALAARIPIVVAPAMNDAMLEHAATRANLATLAARGVTIVEPGIGFLAEREHGPGRLADEDALVAALEATLARTHDLAGDRVLITAGPTREAIDPVRFLSNAATGTTGIELAREALARGAEVDLILGPTHLEPPAAAHVVRVTTAREMESATLARAGAATIVIATAAVADWRPSQTSTAKVKKTEAVSTLAVERTPDILAALGARERTGFLVGFAAETDDHEAHARQKLARKSLDAIVVNDVSGERGFGTGDNALVVLWGTDGRRDLGRAAKRELATKLWDALLRIPGGAPVMLLAIDVGNTETKLGVFDEAGTLAGTWRITTQPSRTADEYGVTFTSFFAAAHFAIDAVSAIVISSVVPVVERPLFEGCEKYFGVRPTAFTAATQTIIPIHTDRPNEVGADLIAAAIAARELVGSPAIAINFGTATTYGAIDRGGTYVGAAIAPGLQVGIEALAGRTAKLPQVALHAPESAIGRETVSAIQAGLIYGTVGATEALVARFREKIGSEARVVASGGFAAVIAGETDVIERVEPHLVLLGLRTHQQAEARRR